MWPVLTAIFIRVRSAQLTLQLPEEIGELTAGADPIEQPGVAIVHGLPVDTAHLGVPELLALQSPCFSEHLPPLGIRTKRDSHVFQIEPAALASGFVLQLALELWGLFTGPEHAKPLSGL